MLLTTLIVGLFGATLMFCGDMALYYDKNDFEQSGSLEPIISIMKKLPRKRVMLGGWIGPVAAFLYCIGFYHNSAKSAFGAHLTHKTAKTSGGYCSKLEWSAFFNSLFSAGAFCGSHSHNLLQLVHPLL